MNLTKFKNTLLVLSIIGLIGSANIFAATQEGKFLVGDKWVAATLHAQDIKIDKDIFGKETITGTPPYALVSGDNVLEYSELREFKSEFREGKGGGGNNNSKTKKSGKVIATNEGLSITSEELLDVAIYDLLGRVVYTATDINNLSIDRNTLNLTNGTYMLRSVNKEGKEERAMFLLNGDSFIISNSKE